MSVRVKIALILGLLFAGLVALNAAVLFVAISPGYAELERAAAEQEMGRAQAAIQGRIDDLDLANARLAAAAEVHAFTGGAGDLAFASLAPGLFQQMPYDLLFVLDGEGRTLWGRVLDRAAARFVELPEFPETAFPPGHPLARHGNEQSVVAGLFTTARGPMMVSSRPVVGADRMGPVRGTVIVGSFLDAADIDGLGSRLLMELHGYPVVAGEARGLAEPLARLPAPGARLVDSRIVPGMAVVYATLADVTGAPALLLRLQHAGNVTAHGGTAVRDAALLLVSMGAIVLLAVLFLLHRRVLVPLDRLGRHVARLTETGDLDRPLPLDGDDELGRIARELRGLQSRVARRAHADRLTGLPNRLLFLDRAQQALKTARRQDRVAAVYVIDLDEFKAINDRRGRALGDRLLQAVAHRLETGLRECDTISRLGGDEFAVIAYGMPTADEAAVLAAKIIGVFEPPFSVADDRIHIHPSVGVALFPVHGEDIEMLLARADKAMARAKAEGRNTFRFYAPDLSAG